MLAKKEKQYIANVIDSEGFDYAFVHYTSFIGVQDEEFHILREKFLAAREALAKYIGHKEG